MLPWRLHKRLVQAIRGLQASQAIPAPLKSQSFVKLHAPRSCAKTKRLAPLQQNRPSQDVLPGVSSLPYPPTSIILHARELCDAARLTGSILRDELLEKSSWLAARS